MKKKSTINIEWIIGYATIVLSLNKLKTKQDVKQIKH
jgi:hypothetical protein